METASKDRRWTIAELLSWTTARFEAAGIPRAKTDAEHLLAHALDCSRLQLFVDHARLLDEQQRGTFRNYVRRRLAREPVAYIKASRGFHALDLELFVDRSVLIPRPETEHLVDWVLETVRPVPCPPTSVIDVGTGSGAIALAIKRARADLDVTGVDVSPEALAIAKRNAEANQIEVQFHQSDLLADAPRPEGGWNFVAANLPYIPTADYEGLEPEVTQFEPRRALDGGAEGLEAIGLLVAQSATPDAVAPGGWLFLEFGIGQGPDVAKLVENAGFEDVSFRKDLAGIERVLRARRP